MITVNKLAIRQGQFELNGVTVNVPAGSYAVMTGPTGCGKTTVLECIAGLRRPTDGRITLCGREVTLLPPAARNVGYVPQDAALFTHLSVWENLAFALSIRRSPRSHIGDRVEELADQLDLRPLLSRRANRLSGGEAQRVALGRALAFRPPVLLLDEPLNAVDEDTSTRLLSTLARIRAARTTTVLHVTHSSSEAEQLADVRLRLRSGQIEEDSSTTPATIEWQGFRRK